MKRHRIALVTHVLHGGGVWTTTRFLQSIIEKQTDYEVEVILLATAARDKYSVQLRYPSTWYRKLTPVQVVTHDLTYWHAGVWLSEFEFQRYQPRPALNELMNRFDLIQVVSGSPAWAAATLGAKPPICAFAATTVAQERQSLVGQTKGFRHLWTRLMTSLTTRIERQVLPRLDCVFAESEYTKSLLSPYVQSTRLQLGPPGIDSDLFVPSNYAENGYILCVGRLNDVRKNLPLLLNAYARLRHLLPSAPPLMLVSRDVLGSNLEQQIRALGLTDSVHIQINVSLTELRQLYQNAALFALTSDEEGLGIVILEAMGCGIPVISTDCGGPATAIVHGETGMLTPVGDEASLAESMASLLANPQRRREMSLAARKRIEDRFTLEAAGKIYLDTYAELL